MLNISRPFIMLLNIIPVIILTIIYIINNNISIMK